MTILNHQHIGSKHWHLKKEKDTVIDCSNISFYDPIGLTFFAASITNQLKVSDYVTMHFNPDTMNYLERIGLLSFLENNFPDRVNLNPNRPNIFKKDLKGKLIEFDRSKNTDQSDLENNISELTELCISRSGGELPPEFIHDVFGELIDNIFRHSEVSDYFVVAQSYSNTIKISISDLGVGIPAKIKSTFQNIGTDSDAIIHATEFGISTYKEGGLGLTTLREYLKYTGDYLFIASNHGCVKFINSRPYIYSNYECEFSGTFVEVCFRTDVKRTQEIEDSDLLF